MRLATLGVALWLCGCGGGTPIVEIPPVDEEESFADRDANIEEPSGPWVPEGGGPLVRLGARELRAGETLELEGAPCEQVVAYVAAGRLRDGGATRGAGTLLRTQDLISLVAEEPSRVVVAISSPEDRTRCVPTDDAVTRLGEPLLNADGKLRVHILLDAQSGATFGSFAILEGDADLAVPAHVHEGSAEVLLIEGGDGTLVVGDERMSVSPGQVIYIPANTLHGYEPGTLPLRAYQVYAPPGPEQRFRGTAFERPGTRESRPVRNPAN